MKHKFMITILVLLIIVSFTGFAVGYYFNDNKIKFESGFNLKGDEKITLKYGEKYAEQGVNAFINNKDYTNQVQITNNIDEKTIGNYIVEYSLDLQYLKKTLKRDVVIVDEENPKLDVKSDKIIYVGMNEKMKDIEYSASDNYDGNITNKVVIDSNVDLTKKGNYKMTYSVKDTSGNETSKTITVKVCDKFDYTYINISISNQKLQYYVNNKLAFETDIVTGLHNGTPTGNYKILKKTRNTYLSGKDYVSFVQYWMAFLGGSYGIHDASWRSEFGGKIYLTNGSHGCVNVPTKAAAKLYNMVEVGTPVHIKK